MATFQLLQEHCLQHAGPEHLEHPDEQIHTGAITNHGGDQQILIEITDSPIGELHGAASVAQDGQQYVVVYDVPANE